MKNIKVASLILAAGEAKRFGQPKQLLQWGDTTILGKVLKEVKKANFYKNFIVLGAYFNEITKNLEKELKNFITIENYNWKEGMFSSIKKGLEYIKDEKNIEYIMILQGDMPFINSKTLNIFIEKCSLNTHDFIFAQENNRPAHPYIFSKKYIDEVLDMEDIEGIRPFVKKYFSKALKISVPYNIARQDIDTWEIYNKLKP